MLAVHSDADMSDSFISALNAQAHKRRQSLGVNGIHNSLRMNLTESERRQTVLALFLHIRADSQIDVSGVNFLLRN